ncbi:unnamed protein product [Plutella xylostella]|uniref:(diamondback moth) hypothetical protein n=1 Tax=Plutella xylostella TaxID=51655 RepID=A0A8S4FND7_PLUXY|nr:unnamed protein product [Plutella xylostella]
MNQVMNLLNSVTKQAASSAVTAALAGDAAPSRSRSDFYLPPFDPDVRSHDIRDWCANVDETIAYFRIPPHEARMKAILQLRGRAKTWIDTWSLHSTTWDKMKTELIQCFGREFRYADDVSKWRAYTSDQATTYAEYATTAWTLFKRVRPEAADEEVIEALITGLKLIQIDDDEITENLESLRKMCKDRMDERSSQDKTRFDKGKARVKPFRVGDFVLLRRHERHTTKLGPKFEGPMEVTEVLPNDRYKLKHVNLRGCSEKIASHDFLRPAPLAQTDPFNINDSEEEEQSVWADTNDGEMPANQSASTSGSILNNGP